MASAVFGAEVRVEFVSHSSPTRTNDSQILDVAPPPQLNPRFSFADLPIDAWLKTIVLLEQEMHNPKFEGKTVQQLRDELTATMGENVVIRRFARFAVGQ